MILLILIFFLLKLLFGGLAAFVAKVFLLGLLVVIVAGAVAGWIARGRLTR
jgi:hypothetical protein